MSEGKPELVPVRGKAGERIPLMEGLPVVGEVDAAETAKTIKQLLDIRIQGKAPHRRRARIGSGTEAASSRDGQHRSLRRRGSY